MGASVTWPGLDELRAALRDLPAELRDDATTIVMEEADGAVDDIINGYPDHTGDLKRKVSKKVLAPSSAFGTAVQVRSAAKHAHLFENGTQTRKNALGQNRGAAPPGRVFVPVMIRRRRNVHRRLVDLVKRAGFTVHDGGL